MKSVILLIVLLLWNMPKAAENDELDSILYDGLKNGLKDGLWMDFQSVKNAITIPKTAEEVEDILLAIAQKEYALFKEDTTRNNPILNRVLYILGSFECKRSDSFLKEVYKAENPTLMNITLDYMILKSDEWFQCSKNIIDSLNTDKYSNTSFRIKFYYDLVKLSREKQEMGAELDSIKYIMYHALVKEDWGYALDFENEYALMEPGYVKSKQRLEILKKFDNEKVKEEIKIRKKEKYAEKDIDLYLDGETAYKTYLKLKRTLFLNNYTPPALP